MLSVSAINFPNIALGNNETASSTVTNESASATVTLTSFTANGAAFMVVPGGSCEVNTTLAAGASCTIMVQFSPVSLGTNSGQLLVKASNASADGMLSGVATSAPFPPAGACWQSLNPGSAAPIYTASDLANMQSYHAYILMNDIVLPSTWQPPYALWGVVLEGNNHTISHLRIPLSYQGSYFGLFATLTCSAVRNLTLTDVQVAASAPSAGSGALVGNLSGGSLAMNISLNHAVLAPIAAGAIAGNITGSQVLNVNVDSSVTLTGSGSAGIAYRLWTLAANTASWIGYSSSAAVIQTQQWCLQNQPGPWGAEGGAVAYMSGASTVDHVSASGNITGCGFIGGLVGEVFGGGTIQYSSASGNISGDTDGSFTAGGLVGNMTNSPSPDGTSYLASRVLHSYATGSVTTTSVAGGLVGQMQDNASVEESWASGAVTPKGLMAGGLVGKMAYSSNGVGLPPLGVSIQNSYATGAATLLANSAISYASSMPIGVGGLVGSCQTMAADQTCAITDSYATGAVSNQTAYANGAVGGLVGGQSASNYTVTSSYWDTQQSGVSTSLGGLGLVTSQMQTSTNFSGWDFSSVWNMTAGSYPRLR